MVISTLNRGFQMTFENGLTISVQFGSGNYCERRSLYNINESKEPTIHSKNAEIAIWNEANEWFDFGGDTVKGYCSANEIAEWIYKASKADNISSIK